MFFTFFEIGKLLHKFYLFFICLQSEAGVSGPKFSDLIQLVTEYLQRGEKNGLACALKTAVEAEGLEEGDRESGETLQSHPVSNTFPSYLLWFCPYFM